MQTALYKRRPSLCQRPTQSVREKFGRLLHEKPNATTLAIEVMIIYSNNKTSDWLGQRQMMRRKKYLITARKTAPFHRKRFKQRLKEIQANCRWQLQMREEEMASRQQKEQKEQENVRSSIHELAFWTVKATTTEQLSKVKAIAQKQAALKVELR